MKNNQSHPTAWANTPKAKTSSLMILDSIRAQIIRDGIEDYQYFQALKQHWKQTSRPQSAQAYLNKITRLKDRFVRFGPTVDVSPMNVERIRTRIARYLGTINKQESESP